MVNLAELGIPLPDTTDRDLAPFWAGTAAGELRVQRSRDTGRLQWPPRGSAVGVADFDLEWVAVPTTGTLFSWTVVRQTGLAGYRDITPYAVGIVQLDEVPIRMVGYLDADPDSLVADEPLVARFVPVSDDITLPIWARE